VEKAYIGNLDSRYKLIKKIGDGSTCDVYHACDRVIRREVAVKIVKGDVDNLKSLVKAEINVLKKLGKHKNLIKFHNNSSGSLRFGDEDPKKVDYIVLGYEKGGDLLEHITNQGSLSEDVARCYFK